MIQAWEIPVEGSGREGLDGRGGGHVVRRGSGVKHLEPNPVNDLKISTES